MAGELGGTAVSEARVWPEVIAILPPVFDLLPGFLERQEPMGVEALVAETAVEGLDERVVGRLARPREIQCDLLLVGPAIHRQRREFRPVVRLDTGWKATLRPKTLRDANRILRSNLRRDFDRQTLLGEVVDDGERSEPSAIEQGVGDEVHAPTGVRMLRH